MTVRKFLRLSHRWMGLLAALWLLLLAITGLLLQQADWLNLSDRYVSSPTLLKWFDYGRRQQAFDDQQHSLYQIDDMVVFNGHKLSLVEQIIAAGWHQDHWIAATRNTLYWLNTEGQTSQQLDDFDGLPTPIEHLMITDRLLIQSSNAWYEVQDNMRVVRISDSFVSKNQISPRPLKRAEKHKIIPMALANRLSYDKVLAAVHAGTKGSTLLNTIGALALMYLSISGLIMFFKPKRRRY